MRTCRIPTIAVFLLGAALIGCAGDVSTDPEVEQHRAAGEDAGDELAVAFEAEVDPETASADEVHGAIAALTVTLGTAEVVQGQLALDRSSDAEVEGFAAMIHDDHEAALVRAAELLATLHVAPIPTETSDRVHAAAVTETDRLTSARDRDFDRQFALGQVQMHAQALVLLRAVRDWPHSAEYRELLADLETTVASHLDAAIDLAEDQ